MIIRAIKGKLAAPVLSLLLSGCISNYHAWDGVKGYQEAQIDGAGYKVSYVADHATRWTVLDEYLARRCKQLIGAQTVALMDIRHEIDSVTVMSSAAIGAPVISGDQVTMPVSSAPHEVVFRLKKAEARCNVALHE
ncbi:hypothetical protein [Alcanivorax sp. DP30]|uniref:hypothetical protein n=1 Tax=Alcanivorax sp. DP30 TaxID=2606217 RepID=UPI00136AEEE4|nr:hypothetical protein [Alcanivorax sp. DP30]MZR61371.1 hypothetical protein [Alcanivorax sp. DP30]